MPYSCPNFLSMILETTKKERKRAFLENGGMLLKELIASSDGKYNPYRSYSEEELKKATNNYDPSCILKCNDIVYHGKWYKGTIEGRVVSIRRIDLLPAGQNVGKWYKGTHPMMEYDCKEAITDVSISAMLSGHKNVLKLLGCCLETRVPTIVYEYVGNGTLYDRIHTNTGTDSQPLSWKSKLEIAGDIAHTIAYLHTAFAKPIIHRQIRPSNILLDQNDVVKLSNFSSSMMIREGETVRVDVCGNGGRLGYASAYDFEVNERIDIRCFGAFLLELLTGKEPQELYQLAKGKLHRDRCLTCGAKAIEDYLSRYSIEDIVDCAFFLTEGGGSEEQQLHQWKAVTELALKCMTIPMEDTTTTMVEVTKQLWAKKKLN